MRSTSHNSDETVAAQSSGNVFADLGLPQADELLVKADLMHAIAQEITRLRLTQQQAAELAGITQPEVSRIVRGKMDAFSQERLIDILRRFEIDVEIGFTRRTNGGVGTFKVRQLS